MFYSLVDREHVFEKSQSSKLVTAIPLCARTVIFIFDNFTFYHYSVLQQKILYQSKLPGYAIQAIAISGHQFICIVKEARALMLFNLQKKSSEQITTLPLTKTYNQNKQKDLLTQSTLINFQKSNSFCILEPRVDDSKTKIFFYTHIQNQQQQLKQQPGKLSKIAEKQLDTRRKLLNKLDSYSKMVLFKQDIDDNGVFKFSTIDCSKQFHEKNYTLHNKAFTRFATIRQIISISQDPKQQKLLIFVNCNGPQILLVYNDEVSSFSYQSKKMFLKTVLINVDLQYAIFKFMPDSEVNNPDYLNECQLVELRHGKVQEVRKKTMDELTKSWEDDYQLQYRRQILQSHVVKFRTYHIIDKKAIYMKMLWQKGFQDLSQDFMKEIINLTG